MNLTNEDVQEILRLLDASSFDELHLTTDRFKLTLRRSAAGGWTQETHTEGAPDVAKVAGAAKAAAPSAARSSTAGATQPGTTQAAKLPAGSNLLPAAAAPPSTVAGLVDVHPPLIGTFYRAPKPGAAPFVEVGAKVGKDTVIGIVETMKLMNSVYAGLEGEVIEIVAGNGELVEPGHVLMRLRPRP